VSCNQDYPSLQILKILSINMYCCLALASGKYKPMCLPLPCQDTNELMFNTHTSHEMLMYKIVHAQFLTDSAIKHLGTNTKSLSIDEAKINYSYLKSLLTCFSHPTTLLTPADTSPGTSNGDDSTKSVHFDLIAAWAAKLAIIKLNSLPQSQLFSKMLYV
jgi:hypothetical protein